MVEELIYQKIFENERIEKELIEDFKKTSFFKLYRHGLSNGHKYHRDLFQYKIYFPIGSSILTIKNFYIPKLYTKQDLKKSGSIIRISLSIPVYRIYNEDRTDLNVLLDIPIKLLYATNSRIVKFLNKLEKDNIESEIICYENDIKSIHENISKLNDIILSKSYRLNLKDYDK